MTAPGARVQLGDEGLSLNWGQLVSWGRLTLRCRLQDGSECRSDAWSTGAGGSSCYRVDCGPLRGELQVHESESAGRLTLSVRTKEPAAVAELGIAGQVKLGGAEPRWVLYNGYQSWDRAGCAQVDGTSAHRDARRQESWWTVGITDDVGAGLAAVSSSAHHAATRFTLNRSELDLAWCEVVSLAPTTLFSAPEGSEWTSPDVLLEAGPDIRSCLGGLAGQRPASRPPIGWLSWYHFGPFVGRDDVVANADLLANGRLRDLGYRLVQVDDGWQQAYGEWVPNTKFPGGLAALAAETRRRGQDLGVWTAPFLVSASADLADQAPPDWFVADPSTGDRLVDTRHQIFGPMYVLDASRPAVQTHLRDLFAGMYAAGVRYFKIDFLYAGGYGGSRALASGLAAIREGVRDAYVLACGAPLLPLAGVAHGCRVGPDTATPLIDFEKGGPRPTIFADEIVAVGRNLAARYLLDGWFHLDPDVALVGGNLTLDQGRQLITLAVLAGGPFLASDDLPNLPPERFELLTNPEVLGLVGAGPAVPDWEPNAADLPPVHWRRGDILAVFNWSDRDCEVRVKAPGARGARDLWAGVELGDFADGTLLVVPANGVRLLRLDKG